MGFALWSDGRDGWDRCTMSVVDGHHVLAGTARLSSDLGGGELRYRFEVDRTWAIVVADVEHGGRRLRLERAGEVWSSEGAPLDHLDGCLDIATDFTPAPLAPYFRRLDLAPGERVSHDVVHLGLDDLQPRRTPSRVAHLDQHHWSHDVLDRHGRIHLGAAGLVVEHDAGWSALAVG